MIVIDSSAVVAMVLAEPGSNALARRLNKAPPKERFMSTAHLVEAGAVLAGRARPPFAGISDVEDFIRDFSIQLVPVDEAQARIALEARVRLGRGFGGPLNFGDTFAYALAKSLDAPLLYVGDDFRKTDIESAI